MFGTLLEVLATTGIVIVLVVFFLIRREDLRDRFIHLIGKDHVTVTTQMLEDAGARVSRYLSMLFLVNITFGVSVGAGLYLIGVPNAILWGILAVALKFIPFLGPWIAAAMPLALSMAISTGWTAPLLTVALFVALELFCSNVMEPWLYGKHTGVSAVAVLVAAVFWMWLWGPIGLLLATPLTVCLLVVGKHVPQLAFLDILLGTEPVFEPKKRIYQRLLAGDPEEAAELLEDYLAQKPLVEVFDTVLIPALALTETHWQLGELNDAKRKFIIEGLKLMIRDCGTRPLKRQAGDQLESTQENGAGSSLLEADKAAKLSILCLPARSEADEMAALLLSQVLETERCVVQTAPLTSLADELVQFIERLQPEVICISATPPAAVMHARYLSQRLRDRFPKQRLLVGLWDLQGDLNRARERIGCDAIVVATLADALNHVRLLLPPHLPRTEGQPQPESEQLVGAGTE